MLMVLCGCQSTAGERGGFFSSMTSPVVDTAKTFWTGDSGRKKDTGPRSLAEGTKFTAAGRQAVQDARELFDAGNYAAAAKRYQKIAKDYEKTSIGEEAQFRLAECHFALQKYPAAQDAYDQLFADYTSTRYVEQASKRLYQIAQQWLDIADPKHRSTIRTVSAVEVEYEDPDDIAPPPSDPTIRYRILPNLHDRTRPVFDTQGRALKALKSIWLNDPLGPMADDALVNTARYYLRRNDYIEADRYFKILREEYPDSDYFKEAHLLGSHVRLMSYQGPAYDGAALEGADQLAAQTLNLFPDTEERQQLRRDRQKMVLLKAQRIWNDVLYYEAKKSDPAVAITCIQLINEFPETGFADMARDRLSRIDPASVAHLPQMSEAIRTHAVPREKSERRNRNVKSVSDSKGRDEDRFRF
jgi:outer membrane protein assembly factor BamD (BamD/ComL family)